MYTTRVGALKQQISKLRNKNRSNNLIIKNDSNKIKPRSLERALQALSNGTSHSLIEIKIKKIY